MDSGSHSYVIVIGYNEYGELSAGHRNNVHELQFIKNNNKINIQTIYPGYRYTIYSDYNNNYYSIGYNKDGECRIDNHDNDIITEITEIKHFKQKKINIKKVCVNTRGSCTFWITDNHKFKLYGNGSNFMKKLGLKDEINGDQYTPYLISRMKENENVIDVQTAYGYSIILCQENGVKKNKIIHGWLRRNIYKNYNIQIPNDIFILIDRFYGIISKLYATLKSGDGGNGIGINAIGGNFNYYNLKSSMLAIKYWKEIEILSDKQIISVKTGSAHTLFLDIFGNIYSCGWNEFGQLGLLHNKNVNIPTLIEYFERNKIKIRSIECGSRHCLAMDINGRIYGWGNNKAKQCNPDSNNDRFNEPILIKRFLNYKIKNIKCGAWHSSVITEDNQYFLFGSNNYKQCIYQNYPNINTDIMIKDEAINNQIGKLLHDNNIDSDNYKIKDVYLGWNNTHIVVENKCNQKHSN